VQIKEKDQPTYLSAYFPAGPRSIPVMFGRSKTASVYRTI
jgi:hypothetical protein